MSLKFARRPPLAGPRQPSDAANVAQVIGVRGAKPISGGQVGKRAHAASSIGSAGCSVGWPVRVAVENGHERRNSGRHGGSPCRQWATLKAKARAASASGAGSVQTDASMIQRSQAWRRIVTRQQTSGNR